MSEFPPERNNKINSRGFDLVNQIKHKAKIVSLSLAASPWYKLNERNRRYHNWDHACEVIAAADELCKEYPEIDQDVLVLAAAWHDAVYVAGAKNDANEIASAQALRNASRDYELDIQTQALEAAILIEQTTMGYHLGPKNPSVWAQVLLDADLSGLAVDYEEFCTRQDNIILEMGGNIETDRKKCADFLYQFVVNRDNIYRTYQAVKLWEEKAVDNIERYVNTYSPSNAGE